MKSRKKKGLIKFIVWMLAFQFLLINISAYLHAYRFTHFQKLPASHQKSMNVFSKTWKLFAGPVIYKDKAPEIWEGFRRVEMKTGSGLAIEGWYSGNDSVSDCVIFFHGVTSRKDYFSSESARFREWGYNVLLVDFRGHGNSEGNSTSFGFKETEEVRLALQWSQQAGNKKNIIYGSSMGAAVVLKAASEGVQPDGLIADMPFASMHDHFRSRARTLGFPSQPFAFLVTFWVGVQNGYNGFGYNVADYAGKVSCPVLVQCGDRDHLVKPDEPLRIFENLASENKKLFIYSGADHHSYLRTHPVDWEENVRSFADSL